MKKRVIIIGAGLSGLAAGLLLEQRGCSDYLILEKAATPGGLCASLTDQGFCFDYAGHFLHLDHNWTRDLVKELLGDNLALRARDSRIYINGALCHYPFQNNLHGMPQWMIGECLSGFREARRRYAAPRPAGEYASFGQWIDETLGEGIGRHFMHPYNEKLWTVPTGSLTTAWMKNYVPATTEEDITRGASTPPARDAAQGYNASFFYPRRGGIGALASAMAERIKDRIRYNSPVIALNASQRLVHTPNEILDCDSILFSAPLPAMAALTEDAPDTVKTAAGRLRAADVLCLNLGLGRRIGWPFSWVYFPEPRLTFFRLGVYSNVMPSMAPAGQSAIYVEIAHRGGDVAILKQRALEDLRHIGLIKEGEDIAVDRTVNIRNGYVLYDKNHAASSALVTDFLKQNHCLGLGRYGRWEYGDMEDSFLHAAECVEKVLP